MSLFHEPGGRWRSLATGPVLALVGTGLEALNGLAVHALGWTLGALVVLGVQALQVRAARTHTSVDLTPTALRAGTETLELDDVATVLPPDPDGWADWQLARALGGSPTVPRGRTGIGLVRRDGSLVQAWARDDEALRAGLETVLGARRGQALPAPDDEHTPGLEHWGSDDDAG